MATTQELLTEAKAALHALNLGQQVVEVRDATGESVRYAPANRGALRTYIADLQALLANDGVRTVAGPMRPVFG